MADEAVIVELFGFPEGEGLQFACEDAFTIPKGTLCGLTDNRTISGSMVGELPFAGIAAVEKVTGDGSTQLTCYTKCVAEIKVASGCTTGDILVMSGANCVHPIVELGGISGGYVVGKALEDASDKEVINVGIGVY